MNCQEVIELMQRQLDKDLDAGEEAQLAAHLQHCSECTEMYERLTLLSNELTNLPKVVPAYSLVDAILPKLGEIDLQKAGSDHDNYSSTTSAPTAQQPRIIPWTRRFGASISWKVAGGVIAAGLVMGFFLFGTNNPLSNQADGVLDPQNNTETASNGASMKTEDTSKSDQSADQRKAGPEASNNAASGPDPSTKSNATQPLSAAPQATDKGVQSSGKPMDQAATPSKGVNKPNEHKDISSKGLTPGAELSPAAASSTPASSAAPGGEASEPPPFTKSIAGDPAAAATEPTPAAKEASPVPGQRVHDKTGGNTMSIASIMPEETLTSQDGKYLAVIEQHQVALKDNATQEILFTSKHTWSETDKISLVKWSEDGKLTYQVSNDTSTQNFQIDVVHKTEVLLK
jgi:hypothetical protein